MEDTIGQAVAKCGRESIQELFDSVAEKAPIKGRRVAVNRGKHKGKSGVVFFHGEDRYSDAGRYCASSMQDAMRRAGGQYGFRVGIETDDGDRFFCCADYVEVVSND